jgi:ribosomal protein S18 acetylase RimI-like enzyme
MKTRQAKPEDLPAVAKVILAAINKERLWTNFVPNRAGQDESYVKEIETLLKEHLDPNNKDWVVDVADLGTADSPKIVAVAVWDMAAAADDDRTSECSPDHPSCPQKHILLFHCTDYQSPCATERELKMNIKDSRLNAYAEVVDEARNKFFNRYPQHMYLQLLATHPDHQNRGYAKDLVHAYIVKAKKTGGVLTTLGGPFGYIFFSGLGFHDLGPVTIPPSAATSDAHVIKAMSLVVNKEERRQSIVDSLLNYISS